MGWRKASFFEYQKIFQGMSRSRNNATSYIYVRPKSTYKGPRKTLIRPYADISGRPCCLRKLSQSLETSFLWSRKRKRKLASRVIQIFLSSVHITPKNKSTIISDKQSETQQFDGLPFLSHLFLFLILNQNHFLSYFNTMYTHSITPINFDAHIKKMKHRDKFIFPKMLCY